MFLDTYWKMGGGFTDPELLNIDKHLVKAYGIGLMCATLSI